MIVRDAFETSPLSFGIDVDPARLVLQRDAQRFVASVLAKFQPDWAVLAPHVKFSPYQYTRNRLFLQDERLEMLLLCWLPGQRTAVHDHGMSWGVSVPLVGWLSETSYLHRGVGQPLERAQSRMLTPGNVGVETQDTIHQVENQSATPVISLHVYAPPLVRYSAYDTRTGSATVVTPPTPGL
ncbi:MAG TPA: cysteine dioxygenase family protein [Candidatus Eremiobacteraceae bacterium]|nr:cysteine dioxygenase family protein [Candidatus Eremiobacteraceae bacterium]